MNAKISAVQMGRDSNRQPVLGIFNGDHLVTQLTVSQIAELYVESGASLEPKVTEVVMPWFVWLVKYEGWICITDVCPEGFDVPQITFKRQGGGYQKFKDEDAAIGWLIKQFASFDSPMQLKWEIYKLDGSAISLEKVK